MSYGLKKTSLKLVKFKNFLDVGKFTATSSLPPVQISIVHHICQLYVDSYMYSLGLWYQKIKMLPIVVVFYSTYDILCRLYNNINWLHRLHLAILVHLHS